MPETAPSETPPDTRPKSIRRVAVGLNSFVQILLAIVLVVALNLIVARNYTRVDLSQDKQFTLSELTDEALSKLTRPVGITAVVSKRSSVEKHLRALLQEYQLKAGDRLKIVWLDPAFQKDEVEQIKLKYDIPLPQESLIVHSEGHTRVVTAEELWYRDPDRGQEKRAEAFVGEAALTSAILNVVTDKTPLMYVVTGRGGRSEPGGAVFTALTQLARVLNIRVEPLNLQELKEIPPDADALVLPGIKYDISERQAAMLDRFFSTPRHSLLVLLDPEGETPRLDEFLASQGVAVGHNRVLYAETTAEGVVKHLEVEASFDPEAELARPFASAGTRLPGQTETLVPLWDQGAQDTRQTRIQTVLRGGKSYWGEKDFLQDAPVFGDGDISAPVGLVLTVERGYTRDAALRAESSRMLVVGNAALLDAATRTRANADLISVGMNWMLNRSELVEIPPKYVQIYRIDMPSKKQSMLFWVTGVLLPIAMFLFGFFIWSARRS